MRFWTVAVALGLTACGGGLRSNAEICDNAIDDNFDGLVDCGDPQCENLTACGGGGDTTELDCADGVDDDGDGDMDCADSDCIGDPACGPHDEICGNGLDDDDDGAVDCADGDCARLPECASQPELCTNGLDDDRDGRVDCVDSDCANDPSCANAPEVCDNGRDDDGDGAVDCADLDCGGDLACAIPDSEICNNRVDDDGDGTVDCDDLDCRSDPACAAPATELCTNGRDDDGDGAIDCDDSDCAAHAACTSTGPELCANSVDDDGDGAVDCEDADCTADAACAVTGPETCNNGVDDNGNGVVDCDDPGCTADAACLVSGTLSPCAFGYDTYTVTVTGPSATLSVDTVAANSTFDPLLFDWDGDPDLYGGTTFGDDEAACSYQPTEFQCPTGDLTTGTYNVMVLSATDSSCADAAFAEYALTLTGNGYLSNVQIDDAAFEICTDGLDNDQDGAIDCDDPECTNSASCQSLVPCDDGVANTEIMDSYLITVNSGSATVTIDTVDAATAFDPVLYEFATSGDPTSALNFLADDTVDCTFQPPSYRCPQTSLATGAHEIVVAAAETIDGATCTDDALGRYAIRVTGDATIGYGSLSDAATEQCSDGLDNDQDGLVDCEDDECDGVDGCGRLLPCDDGVPSSFIADSWILTVNSGTAVLSLDTVSASTTFDPSFTQFDAVGTPGTFSAGSVGDDELTCSFPPPTYACPETSFGVGTYEIAAIAEETGNQCANSAEAAYRVQVTGDATVTPGMWDDQTTTLGL